MSSNDDEKLVTQKDLNQLKDELLANLVSKTEFHQQASLTGTKDELSAAVARLATKDELNAAVARLATKDELNAAVARLATKDELNAAVARLATKDELSAAVAKLATKEELHRVEARLTTLEDKVEKLTVDVRINTHEIMSMKVDLNQFKDEMSEKTDSIITAIDGLAQTVIDMRSEMAAFFYQSKRQEITLVDHEKRISTLEVVTGVTSG